MSKVSLPQGTRDFSAEVVQKRNYIFNTIRNVFELYGFQPLETPAMENLDTLMGKYGEEGDKLIFKILNNGDLIKGINKKDLFETSISSFVEYVGQNKEFINFLNNKKLPENLTNLEKDELIIIIRTEFEKYLKDTYLTKRALRYDLTIPFARYVAMNHNNLVMPFKRYQIQPVWRADRPQRGRYREFYQCDADVVGSKSLINEVELTNIYATVFSKLGIGVEIRINSRKILQALAEVCGDTNKLVDITTAIDKLDKIGMQKVKEELQQRGLLENQIEAIEQYLLISGTNAEKIDTLKTLIANTNNGAAGIAEIEYLLQHTNNLLQQTSTIIFDNTLARGLNYYTGIIFEVKANNVQMGSIGGGGRYDDLTSTFGVPNIPGVGISFGVDRIYDVMEELKLFPTSLLAGTKLLFFNLGDNESKAAYTLMQQLRNAGISCELYSEQTKLDKQFKYAEKKNIAYAIIIGATELEQGTCNIKNLQTGQQKTILQSQLVEKIF